MKTVLSETIDAISGEITILQGNDVTTFPMNSILRNFMAYLMQKIGYETSITAYRGINSNGASTVMHTLDCNAIGTLTNSSANHAKYYNGIMLGGISASKSPDKYVMDNIITDTSHPILFYPCAAGYFLDESISSYRYNIYRNFRNLSASSNIDVKQLAMVTGNANAQYYVMHIYDEVDYTISSLSSIGVAISIAFNTEIFLENMVKFFNGRINEATNVTLTGGAQYSIATQTDGYSTAGAANSIVAGIVVGSSSANLGSTAYTLGSIISSTTAGLGYDAQDRDYPQLYNGNYFTNYKRRFINYGLTAVTIREIGLLDNSTGASTTNAGLLLRKVLSVPVIINPGCTYLFEILGIGKY